MTATRTHREARQVVAKANSAAFGMCIEAAIPVVGDRAQRGGQNPKPGSPDS